MYMLYKNIFSGTAWKADKLHIFVLLSTRHCDSHYIENVQKQITDIIKSDLSSDHSLKYKTSQGI
jgi:hypothetical protein